MGAINSYRGFAFVEQIQIYHFGLIKVYQDANNNKFFTQNYNFIVDVNAEGQFISHLRQKNNLCPFLVQIKNIELERENYCSNSAKISVSFEYIPNNLQSLIERNHIFTQQEVIKILHNLLTAVKYLNDNDSYHGDICPQFIYLDNRIYKQFDPQSGQYNYKIFDSSYFNPSYNGYYRAQREKTYCAPQILQNVGEKRVFPLYNHYIADTFSIGLVGLYCMSLVNPLGAYHRKHEIDFYYIESMFRLSERKGFSQELIKFIRECVQQRNRPNVTEMLIKFENNNFGQKLLGSQKFSLKRSKAGTKNSNSKSAS